MVSSGNITEDSNSLQSIIGTITSEISDLYDYWKGTSHDSLVSKIDAYISDYFEPVKSQMSSFATACELYQTYKTAKKNKEISERNYQKALSSDDTTSASQFSAEVSKYEKIEKETKEKIEEILRTISSQKLSATLNRAETITVTGSDEKSETTSTLPPESRTSNPTSPEKEAPSAGSDASVPTTGSSVGGTIPDTVVVTGSANVNGNVIDTSQPVGKGTQYNLSDSDIAYLAYVAKREQGSVEGAKMELSLMANLYEKNKSKYSSVTDYVKNSGWFGSGSTSSYTYPGDSYVAAAKDVLSDGNRYLASNVVEHDCISDIKSISTGSKSDRSSYIPGETIIYNKYGAKYVFVGFAPNGGDPFGYLVN